MIKGLKRSMPCEDLLSLGPATTSDKALLEAADKFLDDSVHSLLSKRRRVESRPERTESPATAALEAAISFDDAYDIEPLFDSVKISILQGCNDFPIFPADCTAALAPFSSFTNHHKSISLPSVQTVNEMTRAMAYLSTTASKA